MCLEFGPLDHHARAPSRLGISDPPKVLNSQQAGHVDTGRLGLFSPSDHCSVMLPLFTSRFVSE